MLDKLQGTSVFQRRVKRPATAGTGWTTIPAGHYLVAWEVEFDEQRLTRMAQKALEAKGRRSKCGPITVRILEASIHGSTLDIRHCAICNHQVADGFAGECHNCKTPLCDACSDSHACEAL